MDTILLSSPTLWRSSFPCSVWSYIYLGLILLVLHILAPIFPMISPFLSLPDLFPQYMKSSIFLLKKEKQWTKLWISLDHGSYNPIYLSSFLSQAPTSIYLFFTFKFYLFTFGKGIILRIKIQKGIQYKFSLLPLICKHCAPSLRKFLVLFLEISVCIYK